MFSVISNIEEVKANARATQGYMRLNGYLGIQASFSLFEYLTVPPSITRLLSDSPRPPVSLENVIRVHTSVLRSENYISYFIRLFIEEEENRWLLVISIETTVNN